MTYFNENTTRAALEMVGDAEKFTRRDIEVGIDDRDGVEIHVGEYCSVYSAHATGSFELTIPDMPGKEWCYHTLEAAVRAADLMETAFECIRDAAKASREKVTA